MGWKVREGFAHRFIFKLQMKQLGISVCAFKYQCEMDDSIQGLGVYVLL